MQGRMQKGAITQKLPSIQLPAPIAAHPAFSIASALHAASTRASRFSNKPNPNNPIPQAGDLT